MAIFGLGKSSKGMKEAAQLVMEGAGVALGMILAASGGLPSSVGALTGSFRTVYLLPVGVALASETVEGMLAKYPTVSKVLQLGGLLDSISVGTLATAYAGVVASNLARGASGLQIANPLQPGALMAAAGCGLGAYAGEKVYEIVFTSAPAAESS